MIKLYVLKVLLYPAYIVWAVVKRIMLGIEWGDHPWAFNIYVASVEPICAYQSMHIELQYESAFSVIKRILVPAML